MTPEYREPVVSPEDQEGIRCMLGRVREVVAEAREQSAFADEVGRRVGDWAATLDDREFRYLRIVLEANAIWGRGLS